MRGGPERIWRPKPNGNSPRSAGSIRREFAWGSGFTPGGQHMANTWQSEFQLKNLNADEYERTSPVEAVLANGYSDHDMIGNA
jgi:formylglycine-generating enzyme required for sulfatase activity